MTLADKFIRFVQEQYGKTVSINKDKKPYSFDELFGDMLADDIVIEGPSTLQDSFVNGLDSLPKTVYDGELIFAA